MKAIYPGTFDPLTNGHLDLIQRSLSIFRSIIVGVVENNTQKQTLFTSKKRKEMILEVLESCGIANVVQVEVFSGLLVEFAKQKNANVVIRGIRALSDFEYEFQMSSINYQLDKNINTIFLPSRDDLQFVSSRFIKGVAELGGDVSKFVPHKVYVEMQKKLPAKPRNM